MKWREIIEDATADVNVNATAKKLLGFLILHFMNESLTAKSWYLTGHQFTGSDESYSLLEGQRIKVSDDDDGTFSDLLRNIRFLFCKQKGFDPSGGFGSFSSGIRYIRINCVDEPLLPEKVAEKIIYNNRVHSIIIHELIHYIDEHRNTTMLSPDFKPSDDNAEYYNSPVEFNAYFHNIADIYLHCIQDLDHGRDLKMVREIMASSGITSDFKTSLEGIFKKAKWNAVLADFLRSLNDRNHKALLKRLYALHVSLFDKLKEAQDAVE